MKFEDIQGIADECMEKFQEMQNEETFAAENNFTPAWHFSLSAEQLMDINWGYMSRIEKGQTAKQDWLLHLQNLDKFYNTEDYIKFCKENRKSYPKIINFTKIIQHLDNSFIEFLSSSIPQNN